MKSKARTFLISFFAAVSLIICSCGGGRDHDDRDHDDDIHNITVEAQHKLVAMRVPQVPCPSCKSKIEAALKMEPGVIRYEVFKADERKQNVRVVYDPQKITVEAIKELITKMGKTIENITEL